MLLIASVASVQAQRATAQLDSMSMPIGAQQQLTVTVSHEPSESVTLLDLAALDTLTYLEILDDSGWQATATGGSVRQWRLTSFEIGEHYLPSFAIVLAQDERRDTLRTAELLLVVESTIDPAIADSVAIAPIRDILTVPLAWWEYTWVQVLLGIGMAVLLLLAGYWLYRRTRRPVVVATPLPPPIDPDDALRTGLEHLAAAMPWPRDYVKEQYAQLSLLLRTYLERKYRIQALEAVTYEIAHDLRRTTLPTARQERILGLLRLADMVKYAKTETTPEQDADAMTRAQEIPILEG